ncbi:hypothetical protein RRG08_046138 [Elysia crispata]|uniref:Uncharacterized protein n=1 Tax=Elysia crispata TaxID=231223 RepID=A0AAE1DR73_9GAST|nr:hypothetical protein RRG08_046138 [Elysia crispata]
MKTILLLCLAFAVAVVSANEPQSCISHVHKFGGNPCKGKNTILRHLFTPATECCDPPAHPVRSYRLVNGEPRSVCDCITD